MSDVRGATAEPTSPPLDAHGQFSLARAPLRIGVVSLVVRDLAVVSAFYRQVIGLRRIEQGADFERLGTSRTTLIELRHQPGAQLQSRRDAGLFHTAFLLPGRQELGQWLGFAAEARLRLDGAADHLVSEALYLTDPEGNGIEIYRDRPVAEWTVRDGAIQMASDPLDLEGIRQSAAGQAWSGFPEDGTIGHVHLQVGAIAPADAFYTTLLGFKITCRYPGASFYGSGGYHHQLAGNIWNSRGAEPRRANTTGLARVELLTPDPAVITATAERLAAAGYAGSASEAGLHLPEMEAGLHLPEMEAGLDLRDPWGVTISLRANAAS